MSETTTIIIRRQAATQINVQTPAQLKVNVKTVTGPPGPQGEKGDKGDPGDAVGQVTNETPAGVIDGSNATFTTAFDFVPESIEVFVNGLVQKKIAHYNTTGTTTIIFNESPQINDQILINYLKP